MKQGWLYGVWKLSANCTPPEEYVAMVWWQIPPEVGAVLVQRCSTYEEAEAVAKQLNQIPTERSPDRVGVTREG